MKDDSFRAALSACPVFSEEQRKLLVADYDLLEKNASLAAYAKKVAPDLMAASMMTAVGGLLGYMAAKQKFDQHQEGINKSYTQLAAHPAFADKGEGFRDRFSELALIAPTIASNPQLAHKVLEPRLEKGFDLDDVHKLSAIEFNSATNPVGIQTPSAAARSKAMMQLESAVQNYAPHLLREGAREARNAIVNRRIDRDFKRAGTTMEDFEKWYKKQDLSQFIKKSSGGSMEPELRVSEECLGRMLADAHVMYKTASIGLQSINGALGKAFGTTSKVLGVSGGKMAEYFQGMAIPLAIGGGLALLNKVMSQKATAQLNHQADNVFAGLKRDSDSVKENPELAMEAFDALKSFAPSLAAKRLVAKTFVEHVIDTGGRGLTPEAAQQLANTESVIGKLHETGGGSFLAGLKEPMSLFTHKVALPKN